MLCNQQIGKLQAMAINGLSIKTSPSMKKKNKLKAIDLHTAVTGNPPKGWYTGRASINSADLVCKQGILDYVSDSYADDLPYWHLYRDKPHLIIPYTLDANDMRFANARI